MASSILALQVRGLKSLPLASKAQNAFLGRIDQAGAWPDECGGEVAMAFAWDAFAEPAHRRAVPSKRCRLVLPLVPLAISIGGSISVAASAS